MNRVIFLLEEYSMRVLLEGLLPRLFPSLLFQCVHHDGKGDLEKSIPRKLRAWKEPGVRFVIVRDNDGKDCVALKDHLRRLCSYRPEHDFIIRIACQELEAWYLGEPDALADGFKKESLRRIGLQARFRKPDAVRYPARALVQLVPEYQKISGARVLANHLTRERNHSHSFQAMLDGIARFAAPAPSATTHNPD